jgi:hypothetical protein
LGIYAVGDRPRSQIVFDGTYRWSTNSGDDTVTKLRASDGTVVDTFRVGKGLRAIALDGSAFWVGNTDSDNVTRLEANHKDTEEIFTTETQRHREDKNSSEIPED